MMREAEAMVKYIPNTLSVLRIILSLILIPVVNNHLFFTIIYITVGLSDILDGYMARRLGYESELGAKLDSAADLLFYFILVFVFIILFPAIFQVQYLTAIIAIALVRAANIIMTKVKYKKFVFIHTASNKLSGLLIFCIPLSFLFFTSKLILWVILTVVFLSAVEELLITVKFEKPDLNRRSIFSDK